MRQKGVARDPSFVGWTISLQAKAFENEIEAATLSVNTNVQRLAYCSFSSWIRHAALSPWLWPSASTNVDTCSWLDGRTSVAT